MGRYDEWFRIYDSAPVSGVDTSADYRKENSYDDGATWGPRLDSTGEHARIDMTEALLLGRTVDLRDGVVVIESPYPAGGLIRYTPIR